MSSTPLIQASRGMNYLFLTQTLCNFSFYGIKSIFVLYAIQQLSLDNSQAITLFATFMTLAYATSLIGGTIADKLLGVKNTILVGGFLSFSGMLCFALPSQEMCFLGLALISLGSGFFKPNLSAAVVLFCKDSKDPSKDNAYSLFYMAMNLGSLLAPLASGFVSKRYGWSYGILLVAMALLCATYIFYKKVKFIGHIESGLPLSRTNVLLIIFFVISLITLFYHMFIYRDSFHGMMGIIAIGSVVYLGTIFYQCTPLERTDVSHIIISILLFTFFCALFEQAGSSLMLFFEHGVNRDVLGTTIPSSAFLSFSPLFVLVVSPILIFMFKSHFEKTKPMEDFLKIGIGFIFVSLSFLILAYSSFQRTSLVSVGWVVGAILIQTVGELLVVPIILSTISKFAPLRFRSVMMSFWLMAIAYGHYFAGFIAQFSIGKPLETSANAMERYGAFFLWLGLMPLAVAVFLLSYQGMKRWRQT